ncbi:hypothetical protein [Aestuariivivens sediminis]|uniref:hypothetical protein n=1 Tax=Aestuariivivens sediminis TaxID=2913557 RepID=UPI001F5850E5|nr:hypothetical protein [Aestuariivivens sediminis]
MDTFINYDGVLPTLSLVLGLQVLQSQGGSTTCNKVKELYGFEEDRYEQWYEHLVLL